MATIGGSAAAQAHAPPDKGLRRIILLCAAGGFLDGYDL